MSRGRSGGFWRSLRGTLCPKWILEEFRQLLTSNPNIPMNTSKHRNSLALACTIALLASPVAFAGNDAEKQFKKMDTNSDGQISRAEHAAGAKLMFTQCDANKDNAVTAAEMDAAVVAHGEKPAKHDKSSAEKIKMIDQNGDGKLTAAEHEAGSDKMFAMMDKNSDGSLSKEECDEGHKSMKKDK
jgi:Ca2+-binding EF-hand superfamily protein